MPDPKKKKRKTLSKNPGDIAETLKRDYPGYTATYAGPGVGNKSEFRMRSESGKTFTIRRGAAFPALAKEEAEKARMKYRNRNK
jgi:hypothetical protein